MANVKVAIRVRPLNSRESVDGGRIAVQVEDKVVRIRNMKLEGRADSRERLLEFGFDYCYWSVDPEGPNYASQEEVFQDLGVSVLSGASEGYNVCLFAYGQTGSGKTYTMIGTPDSMGLTPRICQGLFRSGEDSPDEQSSSRVEVSFLEIYNERVRDLLRSADQKKPAVLRVREHPETGPYVQGLSQHQVTDYKQTLALLERGIANRITAATHIHDASSRSHAIFTIQYTQATLENNLPSEIVSKINLVDLAGSERADPHYSRDRITEGANINKSLVTLGIVISALAQNSQMFSSCQSINSVASEGEGSVGGSMSSSLSGRRHCYIPYRDSVLTWLLKDSLGGNSKTIMIATVSPSCSSYNESLSTLRYAAHARNIVNKPRVNEDANVRLIRELREEIDRLKSMLLSFGMRNPSPSLSDERDGSLSDIVLQNELKVDQLTKDWSESWAHKQQLLEQYSVDINRDRAGFLVHSLVPHLIAVDRDVLSTGVTFYHLREGLTRIGPQGNGPEEPQIVLLGGSSCEIENQCGVVTLRPLPGQVCMVNGREVTELCRLAQGAVISLGQYKFRFNHPAEAAVLRERRRTSEDALHCSTSELSSLSTDPSVEGAGCPGDAPPPWQRVEEQQRYVELLRKEMQVEQRKAERDLEMEQAHLKQQQSEIEQWIQMQKQRLAAIEKKVTQELGVQTDLMTPSMMDLGSEDQNQEGSRPPSVVGDCKQVVQEELLRHHALRRAENHVRRKRLHYQLQRIARKRHLLEAKRELQRLVNSLPPGQEGPSSPESDTDSRRRPLLLRRHSFSADLLSRLYPQHTPIFSQFLRRNRSSEFTSLYQWSSGPGKADECPPDQPMRGRSHTLPSGCGRGSRSRASSSENLKSPLRERNTPETSSGKLSGNKAGPSRRGSLPRSRSNSQSKSSESMTPDAGSKGMQKHVPIIGKAGLQKNSTKGLKNGSHGGSKGLETIRKVFSRSVGPGIKTALARVFRKPPLGLRTGKRAKPFKATGKVTVKPGKERETSDDVEKRGKGPMKATVSLNNLEQTAGAATAFPQGDATQRRWHSAEALSPHMKRGEGRQQDLAHWIENLQEDEGTSDCDSLFSMDSLSSAYAAALAEQLRQEEMEHEHSESESVDSQMSEDSLVMETGGKLLTVRPVVKHVQVPSHLPLYTNASQVVEQERITGDCQLQGNEEEVVMKASDEMPAEVYWSLCGSPKVKAQTDSKGTSGTDHERQSCAGRVCGGKDVSKMSEEPSSCHLAQNSTPRSLSSSSVREPESLLALTDAWSSMDAADSPRMPRPSSGQSVPSYLLKESSRSLSPSSLDLSDHMSESECQSSLFAESTQHENTVLQAEKYWESDRSAQEPASGFLRTLSEVVLTSGNTLTLASEEMNNEISEVKILTEIVPSLGSTLSLSSKELGNESDDLLNSQNVEELRYKQAAVLQQQKAFVQQGKLDDSHTPSPHGEGICSEKVQSRAVNVPCNTDSFDSQSARKHSQSVYVTSDPVNVVVAAETVTVCLVNNAHVSSQGIPVNCAYVNSQGGAAHVAEDIEKHEAKESIPLINNMSLYSCDVEHHIHDMAKAGLSLKSTLKGIHDHCPVANSSHYIHPTPSGSLLEQSSFDVTEETQIHHITKADAVGSPVGGGEENTKSLINHAVEVYAETTCKEIPADTKDFPVDVKTEQANGVVANFRPVTCSAEVVQNHESESHDITCRKSRKRIKDGQDACTSTLKFPKRCHSSPETPKKPDKDLKDSFNNELNQSFISKDECFVEKVPCLLSEEKCVFELSVAEKNDENEVKTATSTISGNIDTNDSCIINQKISEVVQQHLEMSVDSVDQETPVPVKNSNSSKNLKEIIVACMQYHTDSVQDYCPSSSQTVSLSPQSLELKQNGNGKDVPGCSHQQEFASVSIAKEQTGCGSQEVSAHMDTKSLRSNTGCTSEESLNKGLSVLLHKDIPKELQMDSSKSNRDIMVGTLKEAGKAIQTDVCGLSAKLGKGTLSAGSSMQHTELLKVANTEEHKASLMTGQLGVSENTLSPTVEVTAEKAATQQVKSLKVGNIERCIGPVMFEELGVSEIASTANDKCAGEESAPASKQHTEPLKAANTETGQCGVFENDPSFTVKVAFGKSATLSAQPIESLKVANTEKHKDSVMTEQLGVSESTSYPTADHPHLSASNSKQCTESVKGENTEKHMFSVMTEKLGVCEISSSPTVEIAVRKPATFSTQQAQSLKEGIIEKHNGSVLTEQINASINTSSPTVENAVEERVAFSKQHTEPLKVANTEKHMAPVMTGPLGVCEGTTSATVEVTVATLSMRHTELLRVANVEKHNGSIMTGQLGVSESVPNSAGDVREHGTFSKQHTELLKVPNTGKHSSSFSISEMTSSPTANGAVGESALHTEEALKAGNTEKHKASVMTRQVRVSEDTQSFTVEVAAEKSATFPESLKVANIEKHNELVMSRQFSVSEIHSSPTAECAGESATISKQCLELLKVTDTETHRASVIMPGQLGASENTSSTTGVTVRKPATFSVQPTKLLKVANTEKNTGFEITASPLVECAVREPATFFKKHLESLRPASAEKLASFQNGQLGVSENTPFPKVESSVEESVAPFSRREFTNDGMNCFENPPVIKISNVLPAQCPKENFHFEQTHGQLQYVHKSAALDTEPCKDRQYSQRMDISTSLSDLDTKSKHVASEIHPDDLSGQTSEGSNINDPLRKTVKMCMPEPPIEQSKLIFSQAENISNSQDDHSKHSHSASYLTDHTTQTLNSSGNMFSSQMTVKALKQKIDEKHPWNEPPTGKANTMKYQEMLQGHASIHQCTDVTTVNVDRLQEVQKGDHSDSALCITSFHKPQQFRAVLQVQTSHQQEHAELNASPLSQTNTKLYGTMGPKYIDTTELEVSCHGKHSPDASEKTSQSGQQSTSQEKPCFLQSNKEPSQDMTSYMTVKSKVSVDVCGPRKACSPGQMSKGTEEIDSRDNSKLSGDTGRFPLTKPRDCRDNRTAGNQKVKTKKFRRAQAMAPPSSSSESVPDSSSAESIPVKMHQYRSFARTKPESQICHKQEQPSHSRLGSLFGEDKKPSSQTQMSLKRKVNASHVLASPSSRITIANAKSPAVTTQQKEHRPSEFERKAISNVASTVNQNQGEDDAHLKHILNVSKQLSDTQLDNDPLKRDDATMQFTSVDINPFIHPWQDAEPSKATYKNQVFGSAADICSKYPLLSCPDRQITRCCSVDNGLNVQNSPFNSHLSTYANSKGLSSTLSSVEDFKVGSHSHTMTCRHSSLDANGQNLTAVSCSSSYSGASVDLGNSSGQVDEIMLVYPSEQESQRMGNESISMCDHSTQTIILGGNVKRRRCHHRSSTQVETTLEGKVPATWASLQNMSAHLSELIHNTSDLLGNIQCMRSGSAERQEHIQKTKVSHRHPRQTSMRDGSTQTTLDIGIQTEGFDTQVDHTKSTHKAPVTDLNSKAHEVNVIVKVIGPNSVSVSEGDDITVSLYDGRSGRLSENIKSMPDLRENRSPSSGQHPKGTPMKVPSLETVLPSDSLITPNVSPVFPKDLNFEKVSPSGFGSATVRRCSSQIDVPERQTTLRCTRNNSGKQVSFTDRASSPILTVEAGVGGRERRTSTPFYDTTEKHERHSHSEKHQQIYTSKMTSPRAEQLQSTSTKRSPGELQNHDLRKTYSPSDISIGTLSTGRISDISKSTSNVSNGFSTVSSQVKGQHVRKFSEKGTDQATFQRPHGPQNPKLAPSPSQSTSSYQQPVHGRQERQRGTFFDDQRGLGHQFSETLHRVPDNQRTFWNGPFELSDTSQQQTLENLDDDLTSVAPSECNTDVLVSINPLTETRSLEKQQLIPDDLPLHNKFSNWSGLSQHRPPRLAGSSQTLDDKGTSVENPQRHRVQSECLSSSFNPDPGVHKSDRIREIERLRKEREKVMASVHLEMNPHQLTVEMAEAKLHYGLGETDAMLKSVLKSGPEEQSPPFTKQHLYDRHRRSIEGLRLEREARLQTCRRARSLSPSKHGSVSSRDLDTSPKISGTPTRRREYLQQLRQEVVETSRVPEPQRREGQYPSEIEILLRDYSRAREEARTEIARARDRLRERTEKEKRRLQQTLSQVVRDDLRTRNRVSNSTLCTSSSLSLASSPTSGYNSSNPAVNRDMQASAGALEMGSKVVARPPIGASQNMRSQRTWTSAQDIRLELQGSGSDPRPSSSPSSPPSLRPRALSFGSPSSLATAYQDITSHALTHALAEVRLASAGELSNLLAGKSAAGWRHQGSERGVQVFHKPGPRATVHGFLGAMELERPVEGLWSVIRDHSKAHLYNSSVSSSWTRALDEYTQLVYMLSNPFAFSLKQPRDFCCISVEAKQEERWVLAMQSVYEESLPRPSVDAVRAEVLPSAWILQPSRKHGKKRVTVIYMLQVDLGPPALPHKVLGAIARKQASVIADLDAFFSL